MIQVSPSVNVSEKDLTNIIPAVSSSVGASYVAATWGPINRPTLISSEQDLVRIFGKPTNTNYENWLTIADFLSYSGGCYVVRADTTDAGDSSARNATTGSSGILIRNAITAQDEIEAATAANGLFAAKYAGAMGNSLKIYLCDSAAQFASWPYRSQFSGPPGTSEYIQHITGGSDENAPQANDEMHIVVVDQGGAFTGTPNSILEVYQFLSKASNARSDANQSNYYKTVINNNSQYIYALNTPPSTLYVEASENTPDPTVKEWGTEAHGPNFNSGSPVYMTYDSLLNNYNKQFANGVYDPSDSTNSDAEVALNQYQSADQIDVSLLFVGGADRDTAIHAIRLADSRKDMLAFITPKRLTTGAMITDQDTDAAEATIKYKNGSGSDVSMPSSSYAVFDSGYRQVYDRYSDTYRWIPSNGSVAGLCARTDRTDDPWFSPAGFNRGQLNNTVRLAFNPNQAQRDQLYLAGINPIASFVGQGVVLYGDKTGLSKPSAFDRINVRRLFIILEKAIATASKYQLFEINDTFTRSHFVNMITPYLRDVQGRRGIYDFKVVCDESNNTPQVIDSNSFVGDIYIKPAKSINFIQLNFVAIATGATFAESMLSGGV